MIDETVQLLFHVCEARSVLDEFVVEGVDQLLLKSCLNFQFIDALLIFGSHDIL